MSTPRLRELGLTLILCGACLGMAGCGEQDPIPASGARPEPPRWIHRYVLKELEHYSPKDDIWVPESEVPRGPVATKGMVIWEVSEYLPGSVPTADQRAAANDLVERSYAAAIRHGWQEYDKGLADGYRAIDAYHYRNDEFMLDDHVLDPDRPEVLMYYPTQPDGKRQLTGLMFYARNREARGPQIGGPMTVWHYHSWLRPQCVVDSLSVNWSVNGKCEKGIPSQYSGEMMHVWLLDHPQGPFGTPMVLPTEFVIRGLAKRLEERGF